MIAYNYKVGNENPNYIHENNTLSLTENDINEATAKTLLT